METREALILQKTKIDNELRQAKLNVRNAGAIAAAKKRFLDPAIYSNMKAKVAYLANRSNEIQAKLSNLKLIYEAPRLERHFTDKAKELLDKDQFDWIMREAKVSYFMELEEQGDK